MARILKGKDVADAMMEGMKRDTEALKARGIVPALGIVRLGEREDDISYERGAKKRCDAAGVAVKNYVLPADTSREALLEVIRGINGDPQVHGVLLFRPLPAHINDRIVRGALLPAKDIDGITDGSLAGVFTGTPQGFPPCTAEACLEILAHYGIEVAGKRVTVVGRSLVIGRPVAMMLMHKNGTVTICHTKTRDLPAVVREGDIVIVAAGKPESIGKDHFREGQVVVDVGIHVKDGGALCGDVKFAEVEPLAAAITPVPGGVGTVTTAVLVRHVIEAAKAAAG
ncbi:MAG: bifunctional 5,10-methylenetetrahydrofolate dehydrogenase/5,10-methenyltetrahydrofolate cyclohydrolase [Spirochaetaceae bacterium]|jgi:methylenetetrahydrofolate dehydrogenase (NADP+)/methenyltetrahydrofolate cyclohydrolase|nr:bifunctional 5,10-methylenetetrahydrofolate dehydrogenase/5,10-methenyltetrahydrofolate cyclohydrolase [Spirochaetaceae bacterium]